MCQEVKIHQNYYLKNVDIPGGLNIIDTLKIALSKIDEMPKKKHPTVEVGLETVKKILLIKLHINFSEFSITFH